MFGHPKVAEIIASSLEVLVREVSSIRKAWQDDPTKELWFRGEDDKHSKTTLQPELYRSTKPLAELLEKENRLYDEFRRCGIQLSDLRSDDDWDWYFLMQHHGGPTRLLDWSDGALMALHFAVRHKTTEEELKTDSIVYVSDPYWLMDYIEVQPSTKERIKESNAKAAKLKIPQEDWDERFDDTYLPGDKEDFAEDPLPNEPLLLESEHITRRVAAQRSRFMVFGADTRWLNKLREKDDSRIRKIRIPSAAIPGIQRDLKDCGITESVIFPDLDGMGREVRQLWKQYLAR